MNKQPSFLPTMTFLLPFFAAFTFLFLWPQQPAQALYINVGKANIKRSVTAISPIQFLGTPAMSRKYLKYGKEISDVIKNDLKISSYFAIQDPKSFVEVSKKGLRPAPLDRNGFSFSSWRELGTEFLIKTGYNFVNNRIQLEAYVYYVPKGELVLGQRYSAPTKDVRSMAHKFSLDLVKKITGKKAFFMTKIATSRSVGRGVKEIFVMDWDGANLRQITNHRTISTSPSWSADGRHIAYTANMYRRRLKRRNWDLFLYDFKTRRKAVLAAAIGINSTATFFPNLTHAVVRIGPNNSASNLYKVDLVTKKRKPIVRGPRGAMNVEPSLSRDGKKLAFSSDRSGRPMVYTMNANGGPAKRFTFSGRYNSSPAWSPDGKKIAYAGFTNGHFDIFVMDANGKNQKRLTTARKYNGKLADNEDPTFSPDGRLILFRSNRTKNYQLYAVTVDGKHEYRLTFDNYNYYRPQWSPYLN